MRYLRITAALVIGIVFFSSASASEQFTGGVWIKSNHPDPQNISIFYVDHSAIKAIGHGRITGKPAIWYARGSIRNGQLTLRYRYGPNATPRGWDPEGTMTLQLSEDGNRMSGKARSLSGNWSGRVEFRRLGR